MRVGGRSYTPRELIAKFASMPPRAYVRNVRHGIGGPKRRVTIALVTKIPAGWWSRALGHRDSAALRAWARTDAWVLPWGRDSKLVQTAGLHLSDIAQAAHDDGQRALKREFDLLGSGRHVFAGDIDWLTDFKTDLGWSPAFYAHIDYANLDRPSDVKVPWELSRGHQLVELARAYQFDESPAYVDEAASQFRSWIDANPMGGTVNWSCTMEVGIRATNWAWALAVFAPHMDDQTLDRVLVSLAEHGVFTAQNLEVSEVAGNHYISDALGLVAIGSFFRSSRLGRRWLATGRNILVEEMERQVYPDGVDHEMSVPYHRLVAEIFLMGGLILKRSGVNPPSEYWGRLESMFDFVAAYTRPDGTVPIWGDADDGRVVPFGDRHLADHRHLLSTAAVMFERPDFAAASGFLHEDTLWLLGSGAGQDFSELRPSEWTPPTLSLFRAGGFAVVRGQGVHAFFDAGPVGLRGRGGHGHNDACAVEIWSQGAALVVDPGCYAYTADISSRHAFRATRAHNTPQLEDFEVNEVVGLWQLQDNAEATLTDARADAGGARVSGRHVGFTRFVREATVEREVVTSGTDCVITDRVGTAGHWSARWTFAPGVELISLEPARVSIRRGGTSFVMSVAGASSIRQVAAWFAPSYGVKLPTHAVDVTFSGTECVVGFHVD